MNDFILVYVTCTDIAIVVDLVDGRTISVPLIWFPRLSCANQKQLNNWELLGDGEGIYWPDLDEDLSVAGLLSGTHLKNNCFFSFGLSFVAVGVGLARLLDGRGWFPLLA
jgi:hypothetical protein